MLKTKNIDKENLYTIIWRVTCIFIILQPVFDLLSFLHIRGYIAMGISTYAKPLFIGLVNIALMLIYKKQIWRCGITYIAYLVLMVVHTLLLKGILVENAVILHEIRFMINILYFIICYQDFRILCEESSEKELFVEKMKKVLIVTFALYIVLYLLAVVTGTSGTTYEYSDAYKVGYKGWMDSGQIFGHALCICFPFIISSLLNNKIKNIWLRVLCKFSIALPILVLYMIGTKVSYYIPIIVLFAQVFLEVFFAIRKKGNGHYINAAICLAFAVVCILVYPITPVRQNTDINNSVLSAEYDSEEISKMIEREKKKHHIDKDDIGNSKNKSEEAVKNMKWTNQALSVLEQKYANGELHYADMRGRQKVFNYEKFKLADVEYKLFGIGYVIHGDMAIERDILCVLFNFGIVGFLIVLLRPIILWFKSAFILLKKLFKSDIATLCLFEGFSMFFFISWNAGATFIYTNFSIFLAILMCLLNNNIDRIKNLKDK